MGSQPRLEHFVDAVCPADRPALFGELLPLEIELRRERGDRPCPTEYLARFPDLENLIVIKSFATPSWPRAIRMRPRHGTPPLWRRARQASPQPGRPVPPGEERVGDYLLLEEIARGGMGIVYKARHLGLKRLVALKMILSGSMATPAERARFRREAELAANLDHPNIVPIYEVRDQDGMLFFSMKLIDGGNLAERSCHFHARSRGPPRRLVVTLAQALHYAHGKGFIHCDLKPSNVLIDLDGQPQITDFGLARRTSEDSSLTATGAILGTPSYMAPEQAAGQRQSIGPATDVYGLGAILYELLTGRPPFRTPTMMETVLQVLERDPVAPHELVPGLPRELETICLKCLEKMPEDRYRDRPGTGQRPGSLPSGRRRRGNRSLPEAPPLDAPRARGRLAHRRTLGRGPADRVQSSVPGPESPTTGFTTESRARCCSGPSPRCSSSSSGAEAGDRTACGCSGRRPTSSA